jgi:hypothetical protein
VDRADLWLLAGLELHLGLGVQGVPSHQRDQAHQLDRVLREQRVGWGPVCRVLLGFHRGRACRRVLEVQVGQRHRPFLADRLCQLVRWVQARLVVPVGLVVLEVQVGMACREGALGARRLVVGVLGILADQLHRACQACRSCRACLEVQEDQECSIPRTELELAS